MSFRKQAMKYGAGASLLVGMAQAQAAIDVTAATTGIADAGTAILAVLAALLALSVSIYGVKKVYDFMSRKSGA